MFVLTKTVFLSLNIVVMCSQDSYKYHLPNAIGLMAISNASRNPLMKDLKIN